MGACAVLIAASIVYDSYASRWQIAATATNIYRLNKWTGEVEFCRYPATLSGPIVCTATAFPK